MTITVEELRRTYPAPTVSGIPADDTHSVVPEGRPGYCVGGALCLALGWVTNFPSTRRLAEALAGANQDLDWDEAWDIAYEVTVANDDGEFEGAWAWLDKGLTA